MSKPYKVFIDENSHFMEEGARYGSGEFDSYEEAVAKCKEIIDDYLNSAFEPGMTKDQLYNSWSMFGENPYIDGTTQAPFDSDNYIKVQCAHLVTSKGESDTSTAENPESKHMAFMARHFEGETLDQFKRRMKKHMNLSGADDTKPNEKDGQND